MEYRKLGSSGVLVSALGLGGNTFGKYCDPQQTSSIIHRALTLGVNFIDTADLYSNGLSEEYIGNAIKGCREDVVLATKTGWPLSDAPNDAGLSRRRIVKNLDASLKRLDTDYVDVYYLHLPDPVTAVEESLRAMDDMIREGKVRYVACSNYRGWQIAEMIGICEKHGYDKPILSQSAYNLIEREIETEVIPACSRFSLGIVPFAPLASGFLTGKYHRGKPVPSDSRGHGNPTWQEQRLTEFNFKKLDIIHRFAQDRSRTVPELAIAWLIAQPIVSSVIAGATKAEQVEVNAQAASWELSLGEVHELEAELASI